VSVFDILLLVATFAVTFWFVRIVFGRGRDEPRFAEDDAREYFDEHGHWPDETPEQAAARRAAADAAERAARAHPRRRGI
jgi:hypothetical protein